MAGDAGKGSERRAYDRKAWERGADLYYTNQCSADVRNADPRKKGVDNPAPIPHGGEKEEK